MAMTVQSVTITGADDNVDPEQLVRLTEQFPIVEWGILFSATRAGTPRYPSREWVEALLKVRRGHQGLRLSAHLCGSLTRNFLGGLGSLPTDWAPAVHTGRFGRLQLNGWGTCHVAADAYRALRVLGWVQIILQSGSEEVLGRDCADAEWIGRNAQVLFDASGGTGKAPTSWPSTVGFERLGFAGGINPSNVRGVIDALGTRAPYWIDMESGVRDAADRLDLNAVFDVLQQATYANIEATPVPAYLGDS
jgi:hypothetical protein